MEKIPIYIGIGPQKDHYIAGIEKKTVIFLRLKNGTLSIIRTKIFHTGVRTTFDYRVGLTSLNNRMDEEEIYPNDRVDLFHF